MISENVFTKSSQPTFKKSFVETGRKTGSYCAGLYARLIHKAMQSFQDASENTRHQLLTFGVPVQSQYCHVWREHGSNVVYK